jgi:hypothetical protein
MNAFILYVPQSTQLSLFVITVTLCKQGIFI